MFTAFLDLLDALAAQPVLAALLMGGAAWAESTLGLGTLVPGETAVAVGAGALGTGPVLWLAWVVVSLGAFLGDHLGYLVGRRTGPALARGRLVRKAGVRRWQRAVTLLDRYGAPVLVVGRLVPGVRTLLGVAAGAVGMSYRRYAAAAALAALLWSAIFVGGRAAIVPVVLGMSPLHAVAWAAADDIGEATGVEIEIGPQLDDHVLSLMGGHGPYSRGFSTSSWRPSGCFAKRRTWRNRSPTWRPGCNCSESSSARGTSASRISPIPTRSSVTRPTLPAENICKTRASTPVCPLLERI